MNKWKKLQKTSDAIQKAKNSGWWDCTIICNHPENQPRIQEIQEKWLADRRRINQEYKIAMEDISENSKVPDAPAETTFVQYDKGVNLDDEFVKEIQQKFKESCPQCRQKYGPIEILQDCFGPGCNTYIRCLKCNEISRWEEYCDA